MGSFDPEVIRIRREISQFDKQIEEMHLKVHLYLTDRSKHPHPRHEEFIQRIINYKIRGVRNRELELRLESIQFKAANRLKIWRQWFEDDAKGLFIRHQIETPAKEAQETKKRVNPAFDKIYERTQDAWATHNVSDIESKAEFIERVLPEIKKAKKNLQPGQKIVFGYDEETHRAQVMIKDE